MFGRHSMNWTVLYSHGMKGQYVWKSLPEPIKKLRMQFQCICLPPNSLQISVREGNKVPRLLNGTAWPKAAWQTGRGSQTRLTERQEIKGRRLRHHAQAQTSDWDNIKDGIFKSHDTVWRIHEQRGKEVERVGEKRMKERSIRVINCVKERSKHLPGSKRRRFTEVYHKLKTKALLLNV